MKKDFNEEKAKIIVTIVPFVLIIAILLITLIVQSVKGNSGADDNRDLQENIKEYADENLPAFEKTNSSEVISATSTPVSKEETEIVPEASAAPASTPYQAIMENGKVDYDKITFNKEEQLKEMMTYWADNNQKALDDLAGLDRFKALSWKLKDKKDY